MLRLLLVLFIQACGASLSDLMHSSKPYYSTELTPTGTVDLQTLWMMLDPFMRAPSKPSFVLTAYRHNLTTSPVLQAYSTGTFDPINNHIIFSPLMQSNQTIWHRYDCLTKKIQEYTHGFSLASFGYNGGVFDPINLEIIFIPLGQSNQSTWHKYDCKTMSVIEYTHGASVGPIAYNGGVLDPINLEIIFVPWEQSSQPIWHKYDCKTRTVISYNHGQTPVNRAYSGGCFDPINNKIIFIPREQAQEPLWHRYNCLNQSVESYEHGASITVATAYIGGTFDPVNRQIIFIPNQQATQTVWHKYDCASESIISYAHQLTTMPSGAAYYAGSFDPISLKIFFVPQNQHLSRTDLHYYDCLSQKVVSYPNPFHTGNTSSPARMMAASAYNGSVYDPLNNIIIWVPRGQVDQAYWHSIRILSDQQAPMTFASHFLFNKF